VIDVSPHPSLYYPLTSTAVKEGPAS
jgi:hypothetical protein